MPTLESLQQDINEIKARNSRVEKDKAWETSWTRRIIIFALTYVLIVILFLFASLPNPFINALVPALAFVLSTATLDVIKKKWLQHDH